MTSDALGLKLKVLVGLDSGTRGREGGLASMDPCAVASTQCTTVCMFAKLIQVTIDGLPHTQDKLEHNNKHNVHEGK